MKEFSIVHSGRIYEDDLDNDKEDFYGSMKNIEKLTATLVSKHPWADSIHMILKLNNLIEDKIVEFELSPSELLSLYRFISEHFENKFNDYLKEARDSFDKCLSKVEILERQMAIFNHIFDDLRK